MYNFFKNPLVIIFISYIVINIFSYIVFTYDKKLAKKGSKNRISERFFMYNALFFGSLGILIGMYKNRHKTKHLKFTIGIPILLILNVFTIIYIFTTFFQGYQFQVN